MRVDSHAHIPHRSAHTRLCTLDRHPVDPPVACGQLKRVEYVQVVIAVVVGRAITLMHDVRERHCFWTTQATLQKHCCDLQRVHLAFTQCSSNNPSLSTADNPTADQPNVAYTLNFAFLFFKLFTLLCPQLTNPPHTATHVVHCKVLWRGDD
jgi:hypothetical protein